MDKLIQNLRKVNKLYDDREYNFVDNPIYMDEIIDAETSLTPNSINSVGGHSNITSGTRKIGGRNAQISIVWNVPLNKIGKYSRSIVARSNTFGEFNRTNARRTGAPAKGDKYEYYLHMEDIYIKVTFKVTGKDMLDKMYDYMNNMRNYINGKSNLDAFYNNR